MAFGRYFDQAPSDGDLMIYWQRHALWLYDYIKTYNHAILKSLCHAHAMWVDETECTAPEPLMHITCLVDRLPVTLAFQRLSHSNNAVDV